MAETTRDRVLRIVANIAQREAVTTDHQLREDLGFDSLDRVELELVLEDEFPELRVIERDSRRWRNVADVADYVRNRITRQ